MQFTLFVRLFVTLFVLVTDKSKCRSSSGFTFTGRLEVGFFSVPSPPPPGARKTWRPWLHECCIHSTTCPFNKPSICIHEASRVLEKLIFFQPVKKFPAFMDLEFLLLCSQKPTAFSYYEPDGFNSHPS